MTATESGASDLPARRRVRRGLWFALALALALAHLGVIAFQRDASGDLPWHLALGDEVLAEHRVPLVDRYSLTFAGRPYATIPWLGEAALAASYRATGGLLGPMLLRLACLWGSFLLMLLVLRREGVGRFLALAVLVVAFTLARGRMQLRVELFHAPFLAVLLLLLHLATTGGRRLALLAVVPLCALYAQVHLGLVPLLWCVILAFAGWRGAAFLAPARLRPVVGDRPAPREVALWVGVAAAAVVVALANPTGAWPFGFVGLHTHAMTAAVMEYAPVRYLEERPLWHGYVAVTIAALTLGWHPRALPGVVATAATGVAAILYHRMFGAFALTSAVFVAIGLHHAVARLAPRLPPARRGRWRGVGVAALGALVVLAGWDGYGPPGLLARLGTEFAPEVYPTRAAQVLAAEPIAGPLFNDYNFGGYLLWRFRGHPPVFIDGRTPMLYDARFFDEYLAATRSPTAFQSLCARHGVTHAVLRPDGLGFFAARLPGWSLTWFDDTAMILVRDLPETAAYRARRAYRTLDPQRPETLLLLAGGPPAALAAARREVARARAEAPEAVTGGVLAAALAAAAGNQAELAALLADLARLAPRTQVNGALLQGTLALAQGRTPQALALLEPLARQGAPVARALVDRARRLAAGAPPRGDAP